MEKLKTIVCKQQEGHENTPEYTIGLQLLDMAERNPEIAELLEKDLQTDGMKLLDAATEFKKYANKNHGKEKCFCITPTVAEKILRQFYGLPNGQQTDQPAEKHSALSEEKTSDFIDLSEFL